MTTTSTPASIESKPGRSDSEPICAGFFLINTKNKWCKSPPKQYLIRQSQSKSVVLRRDRESSGAGNAAPYWAAAQTCPSSAAAQNAAAYWAAAQTCFTRRTAGRAAALWWE